VAFDATLAGRIRDTLAHRRNIDEKKMFGCICFGQLKAWIERAWEFVKTLPKK